MDGYSQWVHGSFIAEADVEAATDDIELATRGAYEFHLLFFFSLFFANHFISFSIV